MSRDRIQIEHRPANLKGFKSALAQRARFQTKNNSRFQTGCNVPKGNPAGKSSVPFPWRTQKPDQLNNLWVNLSQQRPVATSAHSSSFRRLALWWARRPFRRVRNGPNVAITAAESPALYRGFVACRSFDQASIEHARITSSAHRREAALPHILDDRRSDDPRRGWVG